MKNQFIFWTSLLLILGAAFYAQGQAIAKPWEIGFGGGMNWQRAKMVSSSSSFEGWEWWIINLPPSTTTVKTTQSGDRVGYQGSAVISLHPHKRFSLLCGLNIMSVESHAVRSKVTVYYHDNSYGYTDVNKTEFQIDKEYVLLDVPLVFRWYVVAGKDVESPVKLFLDFGRSLHLPLKDKSMLIERENGELVATGKVGVKRSSYQLGLGLQVKQYALTYGLTGLGSGDSDNRSTLQTLTLVRYFGIGK